MRAVARRRRRAGDDRAGWIARRRELQRLRRPIEQRRGHQLRDRRMPNRFDVRPANPHPVQLQHPLCGVVGELKSSLAIHHDDPFDHTGQDGLHSSPIPRLFDEAAADVLDRLVQRSRHHAELVVAEIHPCRCQVAASIPSGDIGDAPDPLADSSRKRPGDERRTDEGEPQPPHQNREHGPHVLPNVGERQGNPDETDRRMVDRYGDVQHVDVEGVAVPFRAPESSGSGLGHLGARAVIFHRRHAVERLRRVADHPSIGSDQRDARAGERAEAIGFSIELGHGERDGALCQEVRGEPCLRHERRPEVVVHHRLHHRGEERPGDGERNDRRGEGGEEELGLERPCTSRHG